VTALAAVGRELVGLGTAEVIFGKDVVAIHFDIRSSTLSIRNPIYVAPR
jgi:hypothetical protein